LKPCCLEEARILVNLKLLDTVPDSNILSTIIEVSGTNFQCADHSKILG